MTAIAIDATRLFDLTDDIRRKAKTVNKIAGRAVQGEMRSHLLNRNRAHPNRLGGKRTNYWQRAGQSITVEPQADGSVIVAVTERGIGLHYHGGKVKAGSKKLAIPVHPDAHGKSPREFSDLQPVFWKRNGRLQMGLSRGVSSRGTGRAVLLFVLKDEVTIQPDAEVLPSQPTLNRAVETAVRDFFAE